MDKMVTIMDCPEWNYGFNVLTFIVLLGGVLYTVTRFLRGGRIKSLLNELPGLKPSPIYGDRALFTGRECNESSVVFMQTVAGYAKMFEEEGLFLIWIGRRPFVFLFSPETLQPLLSSTTEIEKGAVYRLVQPWFKAGLLTSTGEKWRQRRKFLTPAFHSDILRNFLPVFDEQSKILIDKLEELSKQQWFDITLPITLCTLDTLCETAMGVHLGAQKNRQSEYATAVFDFLCIFAERKSKPWLWNENIFSMTQLGKKFNKTLKTLVEFTKKAVDKRKRQILEVSINPEAREETFRTKRMALMDLLLTHHFNGQLTESDICEEIDTFMFAGHDTTAVSICWTLYNLGLRLDVQQKVYEELLGVFGEEVDRTLTMDDLRKMKYLECVIKESLRIYPAVPIVSRHLKEDLKVNGFTIPRGVNVTAFIYGTHHNSKIYPNPEVFDPGRFLPEKSVGRHPYAFIPFSAGSRNCIGQRFALFEEKAIIANVVRNFKIKSLDPPDKLRFCCSILLKPNGGNLRLNLTRRMQ